MKDIKVIALLILIIFISGCTSLGSAISNLGSKIFKPSPDTATIGRSELLFPKPTDYRLGIDDLIEVNIWKHPDLSKEVIVRPDGKISYLLIGDVQAAGLTVSKLDAVITKRFEEKAKELEEKEVSEVKPVLREYRIAIGDVLDILVWKIPDLAVSVTVRPDGRISYPLVGEIDAYGRTLTELDSELTEKLIKYVKDPQVSIIVSAFGEIERRRVTFVTEFISTFLDEKPEISILVKRFGSRKVIVLGEVNSPGIYDIVGNARLLDAIAYAGDFNHIAVRDNVLILRGDITANPQIIKVNVWDILRRRKLSHNIPIQNQDIIYVPRTTIGNVKTFIESIYPNVSNITASIILRDAIKSTGKK